MHRRYLVTRVWAPNWVMAFAAFYESESKGKLRLKDNILGVGVRWGVGGSGQGAWQGAAGRGPAGARAVRR